jgi:hypothetical protein
LFASESTSVTWRISPWSYSSRVTEARITRFLGRR